MQHWIDSGYLPDPSLQQITLYDYGNEYTLITGGWGFVTSPSSGSASYSKQSNYMHISSEYGSKNGWWRPARAINFTGVTSLKITYTVSGAGYPGVFVDAIDESMDYALPSQSTAVEQTLDVFNLNGSHTIYIGYMAGGGENIPLKADMKIYKVELLA